MQNEYVNEIKQFLKYMNLLDSLNNIKNNYFCTRLFYAYEIRINNLDMYFYEDKINIYINKLSKEEANYIYVNLMGIYKKLFKARINHDLSYELQFLSVPLNNENIEDLKKIIIMIN